MIFTSNNELPIKEKQCIFLAGSMDFNRPDNWRKQTIHKLSNYNFFDPTNKNHDSLNEIQMKKHIEWELDALLMADKIILNFLPNSLSPISLVELGLYMSSQKLTVICPKEFYKSKYVYTLCEKYNTPVFLKIEEALNTLN